jgi:glyoxylase-like metal-dependent hydrolase (beta-lactamase superfamily II)
MIFKSKNGMAKVKILIKGYVKENGSKVVPTTTLIQDEKINIIVDPGMGKNKKETLKKFLEKEHLDFNNINIVFCTHYHLDHIQYIGLFPKAKIIDYKFIYQDNNWLNHQGEGYHLSPNVFIIHTPGHSPEHASLGVKTFKGTIVVAGDVWWHSDFTPKIDRMAWNQKILEKSRKRILKIADYIIPGHGGMVRV